MLGSLSFRLPLAKLSSRNALERDLTRAGIEQRYDFGTRIVPPQGLSDFQGLDSRALSVLRVIANFNSEPMFPGNGFVLFNKTSRLFTTGRVLSSHEVANELLLKRPIMLQLARIKPAPAEGSSRQVRLHPMEDFNYHIETSQDFLTWWQRIGRNFCDGVF